MSKNSNARSSRRDFLRTTSAGAVLAVNGGLLSNVHAGGDDALRIGLIGCGGRGTGAADNCLNAAPNLKLVAIGDTFKDRVEGSYEQLKPKHGDKVDVPPERRFVGLDAFEKVLGSGIDYVILATPPGFRPQHIQAAVAAGKHIFTEKPVGVDGPGIRKVLQAYEDAKAKNLGIAAGTQRRHQKSYLEAMKRVHGGEIGDIVAARCYWNQGALWVKERQPDWSDLEWQIRNWLYFTWLSGDHYVEQHVHNLDVVNWGLQTHPLRAAGMGGRQERTDPKYGHIFDHFAVDFEFPNGVHSASQARQIPGCENNVSEALVGAKGTLTTIDRRMYVIKDNAGQILWSYNDKKDPDPYQQEHTDLIESIRAGKPINELKNVAESTLTAIMGRMSAYTGKAVTWDQALQSQQELMPPDLSWTMKIPVPDVACPGKSPLV